MADLAALLRDFAQGASNSAAGTLTGPVDLTAWLLRKGGLDIKNPVGGSDWMAEQGLMKQPENYWAGLLGESAGAVLPFAGSKQGVNALLKMQENAANAKPLMVSPSRGGPVNESSQKGIFAGEWSRTADQAAREKAIELLDAGVPNREVYAKTGWFKGPDGKLRYEIPDNAAKYYPDFPKTTVDVAIEHDDLFKAYPVAKDLTAVRRSDAGWGYEGNRGSFDEAGNTINIADELGTSTGKSTMLHELQHFVQSKETGFGKGGTPSRIEISDLPTEQVKLMDNMRSYADRLQSAGKMNEAKTVRGQINNVYESAKMDAYRKLAGEAEARAVQARMNMTPAERRASFPLDSWDVPLDQLIFKNGAGPQMSASKPSVPWADEFKSAGGTFNSDGTVTVYHRTSKDAASSILNRGVMTGKEDGLFFSSRPDGQATGYGDAVVKLRIPANKLSLDDLFNNEAHLRLDTGAAGKGVDVSKWIEQRNESDLLGGATPGLLAALGLGAGGLNYLLGDKP